MLAECAGYQGRQGEAAAGESVSCKCNIAACFQHCLLTGCYLCMQKTVATDALLSIDKDLEESRKTRDDELQNALKTKDKV